jgi:TctA family transporter
VNDGSFAFLWQRPVTAALLAVALACVAAPPLLRLWRRRRAGAGAGSPTIGG